MKDAVYIWYICMPSCLKLEHSYPFGYSRKTGNLKSFEEETYEVKSMSMLHV